MFSLVHTGLAHIVQAYTLGRYYAKRSASFTPTLTVTSIYFILLAGFFLYCMLVSLYSRLRFAARLSVAPLQFTAPSKSFFSTRSSSTRNMFQQAVNKINKADSTKQLFPSSSPAIAQSSLPQYQQQSARPLSNVSGNLQRQNPTAMGWKPQRTISGGGANIGIKRTAGGLQKIASISDGFEDVTLLSQQPIEIPDDSPVRPTSGVYFDENDFDSDVDLDIEDLSTQGTVTYPKLPQLDPRPQSQAEELRNIRHTTAGRDSGYGSIPPEQSRSEAKSPQVLNSSAPVPWSSSPPEHLAPPPLRTSLAQYRLGAHTKAEARPTKRRTMPWLQKDSEDAVGRDGEEVPSRAIVAADQPKSKRRKGDENGDFTPAPKNAKNAMYPWNTTASAVKEQQKILRQAKKKPANPFEKTEKSLRAAATKKKGIARPFLSEEQQHILKMVVEEQKSVFFTGSAGTGKSVLLREIIAALKKKFQRETDRVAVTASTGLAACNIGGVTLHSFAGFGLGKEDVPTLVKKVRRNQKAKNRWSRTKVLVIDEISMVDGDFFDKLEGIARMLRNNGRPFGGLQLVITGDFFQLPPVPDYGKVAKFAFDAATWNSSIDSTIALHHVFRQKDPEFAAMLNEMREGRLSDRSVQAFRKLSRPINFGDDMEATELFPTRQEVEMANGRRMHNLVGETRVYEARDGGAITDKVQRDKLLQNCMAPDVIHVKKGAQVMLIKNIDDTLVNGSLGKVVGFMSETMFDSYEKNEEEFFATQAGENDDSTAKQPKSKIESLLASTSQVYPVARFQITDGTTRDLLCQRETWKIELPNGEVQASRAQIPLILAWSLSIHKAQGQTLERVKVDLGKVFEKGQAYVALSRATSMAGLQVLRFEPGKVMAHEKVREFYRKLKRIGGTGEKKGVANAGKNEGSYVDEFGDDEEALAAYG